MPTNFIFKKDLKYYKIYYREIDISLILNINNIFYSVVS
jgi:hypothetical protein